ncbi:MAG: GntR family transcriptional regulator [Planctomycetes bacterium]|nr:GntR family transcriptional regulator [Planctomycetota bacterium]
MTLKQFIKQDLAARVLSGNEAPSSLTLNRLSARYNVSITPVREAVSELLAEGVLQRDGGRRLTAGRRQLRSDAQAEPSRPTTPEERFEMVSQGLVQLSIKGEPVLLREHATAEKYDLSRTAIRQIFHRLASDGLLEHLPRRGWRLRPFRQDDLDSYTEIRVALERKALELAKHRLIEEDLSEMLEQNRLPENEQEAPKIDDRLHAYLIAKAENSYIANFFARQGKYYAMLFDWEALDRMAALQAVEQHREILESLIARNWEAAADRLENHIRHGHPVLERLLEERTEIPDGGEEMGQKE